MSEAGNESKYFRLLDLLVNHTIIGNIHWAEAEDSYSYEFHGASAGIRLETVDGDGQFPLRLVILDSSGEAVESYETQEASQPEEAFWDDRVRSLWELIGPKQEDPVGSLIEELGSMPPF